VFVNDENNWIAEKAMEAVESFLMRNPGINIQVKDVVHVTVNESAPAVVLDIRKLT